MALAPALQPTTTAPKPAYKPTVRLVDIHRGLYRVSSSDGTTWYDVNVATPSCTCKAGEHGFTSCKSLPYCKHVAAAKLVARAIHDSRQPKKQEALVAPIPITRARGAAGLLEAFGQ